jgi:hypothetical protein
MAPRRSSRLTSSADLHAAVAHVTPDVLALLGDSVSRTKATFIPALVDRYARDDVRRTLMHLVVLEQVVGKDGQHTLPPVGPEPG